MEKLRLLFLWFFLQAEKPLRHEGAVSALSSVMQASSWGATGLLPEVAGQGLPLRVAWFCLMGLFRKECHSWEKMRVGTALLFVKAGSLLLGPLGA